MHTRVKVAGVAAAVGGALALGFAVGHASADQPHMEAAVGYLQSARGELISATSDKGGYRARAIREVDAAIADTRAGMRWDRRH
jgi:hypothetical protein